MAEFIFVEKFQQKQALRLPPDVKKKKVSYVKNISQSLKKVKQLHTNWHIQTTEF